MQNPLREILINEQTELQLKRGVKFSIKLLAKLANVTYDKIHHPERYNLENLKEEVRKLKKVDFSRLIKFKC